MIKNKKAWLLFVGVVALLLIGGAGGYTLVKHTSQVAKLSPAVTDVPSAASAPSTVGGLGAATPDSPVTNQTGAGLQGMSLSANASAGQAVSPTRQNTSASSPSTPQPFDPTTFSQYEKYKDDTSPLWADVQTGTGGVLESGHKATVYYRGWLTNGTLFDQSRADANGQLQPFSFTTGAHQVISGWDTGLIGMKTGGVRLLIVPSAVGYGASAQGSIPANSLLVFQVQLVSVD